MDHFQHEVYENPEWSPKERRAAWRKLEQMYLPWKDYSDNELLEAGAYWFRQGHIFSDPFYYIDYTLAQIVALQFFSLLQQDKTEEAWESYLKICRIGGTESFLQVIEAAELESPFKENILEDIVFYVESYLQSVDTTQFN